MSPDFKSQSSDTSDTSKSQLKIGHYLLGVTLGAGTFGKVKGNRF